MAMIHTAYRAIVVIVVSAGLLGAAVLLRRVKPAHEAKPAIQHDIWVGDALPALPGYSWEEHNHSLVLAMRTDCSHCKASAPLYRQVQSMVADSANRVGVIAIFPNSKDKVKAFLQQFNLDLLTLSDIPLERLAVSGTPTLILVDSRGAALRVWVGELDSDEQRELFTQLHSYLGEKRK
jgi:thiol-disulfide isomerase/thioredoxin